MRTAIVSRVTSPDRTGGDGLPAEVLRSPGLGRFQLDRRVPAPGLEDIVEWTVPQGEEREQDVLTHPCIHLTVEREQATVTGVVTRCFRRTLVGSGRVVGVRFRPAGFSAFARQPMSTLTDQAPPAVTVLGTEVSEALTNIGGADTVDEAVGLMNDFLDGRRRARPPGAKLVDDAVDHIVAHTDVTQAAQVAEHFSVSLRTLQRHFERHLGVGPKWVIQRRRIHEALDEIEVQASGQPGRGLDWATLAVRLGYADQAHFVKAFTELVGRPPTHYAS